jgi:membrane protein CcdC involved in cytochrome C biogenesis
MFLMPGVRIPSLWIAAALGFGALLSIPLRRTSRLERMGGRIMMRRSPAFLMILLCLGAVRIALHGWIDPLMSPLQTGAVFFTIAFGMIFVWRVRMLAELRRLAGRE